MSGKSRLLLHLIKNPHLFSPAPSRILFYYDQMQDQYLDAKRHLASMGVELRLIKGIQGLAFSNFRKEEGQTLVIVDDFSEETSSSPECAKLATNGRHLNISLICVWHSLYNKHPASRIICQNVRWFFFLPSLRHESQLRTFGAQLGMKNLLLWAFHKCQGDEEEHKYLLVDAGPYTPTMLRLRSHIHHPDKQYCYV